MPLSDTETIHELSRLHGAAAAKWMRIAAIASILVAAILVFTKAGALLATGSAVILATLIDSILDGGASILNFIAVRHSLQPADDEHRFGHGKAEAVAALGQAAFIGGSAAFLTFESARRMIDPEPVTQSQTGIAVTVFAIVLTIGLVGLQRYVARRTGSLAISADSMHYGSDLLLNIGVIIGLVLSGYYGIAIADP
ncbi:MAG TPA: divalent metal cation transporter FieF, partial [Alphaproteobacteria bacterium]|nr:divalent metal cation transporter FieF [Alphaproteobacteria bacterium]